MIISDKNQPLLKYKSILDRTAGPDGYDFIGPYDEFDDDLEEEESDDFRDYYAFQKLPDYLPIRNQFLLYLLKKNINEVKKYFEHYPTIKSINPEDKILPVSWVADYCQTVFIYFILTDQLLKAKALLYEIENNEAYYENQLEILQAAMSDSIFLFTEHLSNEDE